HHLLHEPPKRGHREKSQSRRDQSHRRSMRREIDDRADDGQACGRRKNAAGEVIPKTIEYIDGGEPRSAVETGDEIRRRRYREQKHRRQNGTEGTGGFRRIQKRGGQEIGGGYG